jgi:acyl carrier protein
LVDEERLASFFLIWSFKSMESTAVESKVIKIVAEKLNIEAKNISAASRFQEDLGADSLDIVELLMEIEEDFGVSISDDESEKLKTVGDAIKFISSKA